MFREPTPEEPEEIIDKLAKYIVNTKCEGIASLCARCCIGMIKALFTPRV